MGKLRWSKIVFTFAYVVLVAGVFLALGGSAYAASSTSPPQECDENNNAADYQYCNEDRVAGVQVSATAGGDTASAAAESQALPNTGLSLLGVVVVGGALVAGGLLLRRREQHKS